MSALQLQEKLHEYGQWRTELIRALDRYTEWLSAHDADHWVSVETIQNIRESLHADRVVVAFAGEFSRGKTELINALFFSDTGVRLLPSLPGRTTMCPTEIFYDPAEGSFIRLLPIETRLSELTLGEHKLNPSGWLQIDLDHNSPRQMQEAFQQLAAIKKVSWEDARFLGLFNPESVGLDSSLNLPETVEVPCWRHALISFPHELLKAGLTILDTPGLNSLGAEPELTLRMLPSAQSIIFVLSADTGVTKSDLEMWNNHVRNLRRAGQRGLAVAMNKIDTIWDDLQGEAGVEQSIRSQVQESARQFGLDVSSIFPVSAKQALVAKVRQDAAMLEKSRIRAVEDYLSSTIVRDRQALLKETVITTAGRLINESLIELGLEVAEVERQLDTLRKVDLKNRDMTASLLEDTRLQQTRYLAGIESFQSGSKVFQTQMRRLLEALSPATINPIVKEARDDMLSSLTTMSMKAAMKAVLEDLSTVLEKALAIADETRQLVKAIYGRFEDEFGFRELEPPQFSLNKYQVELQQLFREGDDFRQSVSSTLMEQRAVVRRLYTTIIAEACGLFAAAHQEAGAWGSNALVPLVGRIKGSKRLIETRLEVLRKVSESSEALDLEITKITGSLEPLRREFRELRDIQTIVAPEYAFPAI